jgi:hypothetical protein
MLQIGDDTETDPSEGETPPVPTGHVDLWVISFGMVDTFTFLIGK